MPIPKNNNLLNHARRLRKEMTPQELRLWYRFLRGYPIKIYKQRIIGDYIASARLVIEVDGSQHYEERGKEKDAERSAFLESLGLRVLRFSNREINCNFSAVCEQIDLIIKERLK